ncbi:MAG: hypothetical protein F6K19_36705 [Cyanothece sp. SIO1E1]|nr:hypothetical protein [Cyanothece sp. SIO1E1]
MITWTKISGVVVKGHGVASGQANDSRFPEGTIQMQKPAFSERGLCLDAYFPGTLNISILPHSYAIQQSKYTFREVKWAADRPAEDFSFFDCRILLNDKRILEGLIYYPHPETKPEHRQDAGTLEVLTAFIDGLRYGDTLVLEVNPKQIMIGGN